MVDIKLCMQLDSLRAKAREFPCLIWSVILSRSFLSDLTELCIHNSIHTCAFLPLVRILGLSYFILPEFYCVWAIFSAAFTNVVWFRDHWEYPIVKITSSPKSHGTLNYIIRFMVFFFSLYSLLIMPVVLEKLTHWFLHETLQQESEVVSLAIHLGSR